MGFNTYDSAVVIASNASEAVSMHPDESEDWDGENSACDTWTDMGNVKAELIGTTDSNKSRVILASYNAG